MPDITMCPGSDCPLKADCYRHTATPSEYWQSYFLSPPYDGDKCEYFWPNSPAAEQRQQEKQP